MLNRSLNWKLYFPMIQMINGKRGKPEIGNSSVDPQQKHVVKACFKLSSFYKNNAINHRL